MPNDNLNFSCMSASDVLGLREHSSILTNGMTLLRSEIDSLIASVCCT